MNFDPFDLDYTRDPATTWRRLPMCGPGVGFDTGLSLWIIAGRTNVRDVLADAHYRAPLVEESLRHSPAIDGLLRLTTTKDTIDGVTIPADNRCQVPLGTAGHHTAVFTNPDTFNPRRAGLSEHLGFGHSPHAYPFAVLACLELSTALDALARRLPSPTLTSDHERRLRPSGMPVTTALRYSVAPPARRKVQR